MEAQRGRAVLWLLWGLMSIAGGVLVAMAIANDRARDGLLASTRRVLLPGATTSGHHQIEIACKSCHTSPFTSPAEFQEACIGCHGEELKVAEDKHPLSKFTDPRNVELLERIDAAACVTCHTEHRPKITHAMGVTQPNDVCAYCHRDIGQDRPSHRGMGFDTCASAGCHNFHDNRALYEDFLVKHLDAPKVAKKLVLPAIDFLEVAAMLPDYPRERYPLTALDRAEVDAPPAEQQEPHVTEWLGSAHAAAGVNCSACHRDSKTNETWIARPDHRACESCHAPEVTGFLGGKHGMRLAHGLSPMTPEQARLPMRADAADRSLICTTCHGAHTFDTRRAAVEACLGCHADEHSLAYRKTPHAKLWHQETNGLAAEGTGVSCATCHLPRIEQRDPEFDLRRMVVQHNQNDTLRPNEKMLRPVCLECHGLPYALDALADREAIRTNFAAAPQVHVRGPDMARQRMLEHEAQRGASVPVAEK